MPLASFSGFSQDAGAVTGDLQYDTATLLVANISWQNTSTQAASISVLHNGVVVHAFTLPAGTPPTDLDVSAQGVHMVAVQGFGRGGGPVTIITLPTGWEIDAAWPA